MSADAIEIALLARPRKLSTSELPAFEVGIVATNRGTATVDPRLDLARLEVNGQDSLPWADAIANGLRDAKWFELPPGESITMSWPSMGEILFPTPGAYRLQLRHGDTRSAPAVVHVDG